MSEQVEARLQEALQARERMEAYRNDAEFQDTYQEQSVRLQQALVEIMEALYHQNDAIIALLRGEEKEA